MFFFFILHKVYGAFFFFFFFQAEDGIRDLYVTGVQTCALPISLGGGDGGPRGRTVWPSSGSPDRGLRNPSSGPHRREAGAGLAENPLTSRIEDGESPPLRARVG